VDFFDRHCRHTDGRFYGQPFGLRDWQAADVREVFGRVDEDGNRVVRTWYEEIPKKNGKSEVAAAVALKLLFADDEPSAEVYGAASDRYQASIVFDVAAKMVRLDKDLLNAAGGDRGIIDSRKRIVCPAWNSFYWAISAKVAGKHGFKTHGCIFDEVHAQPNMQLWEVLTFGAGASRRQPLTFAITTAGLIGQSPVAEMLHQESDQMLRGIIPCPPSFYPVMYGAPDDAEWGDEEVWRYANPALGDFKSLESVRDDFSRAKRRPAEQNSFRRLHLNQWVQQEKRWIDLAEWDQCNGSVDIAELKRYPCYAGIDVGASRDITALVLTWMTAGEIFHWLPFFWVPRATLEKRTEIEAEKYRTWADRGLLTLTDSDTTDPQVVRQKIKELRSQGIMIRQIASDKTFALQLQHDLEADGFMSKDFPQGTSHYNEPCRALEDAIHERRIRHGGHPILRWMIDCVEIHEDRIGRIMPTKPRRGMTGKRIDGVAAALMGMSRAILDDTPQDPYSQGARLMVV
jgi:phage terminase large subunit-like protein